MNDLGFYGGINFNGAPIWQKPRMAQFQVTGHGVTALGNTQILANNTPNQCVVIDFYRVAILGNTSQAVAGQNSITFNWGGIGAVEIGYPYIPNVAPNTPGYLWDTGLCNLFPASLNNLMSQGGLAGALNIGLTTALVGGGLFVHVGYHIENN